MLYGHSLQDKPEQFWQTLEDHQNAVAEMAGHFADFGVSKTAKLLGSIHDTGKRSDSFQNRLHGKGGKVDHTSAAYLYLMREWGKGLQAKTGESFAQLLAYPLFGHHGGMMDFGSQAEEGTLAYRISGPRIRSVPDWKDKTAKALPPMEDFLKELKPYMCLEGNQVDAFATAFLLRILYSCLVDADFLDTERFCSPERHVLRPQSLAIDKLKNRFFKYLREKGFLRDEFLQETLVADGSRNPCGTSERREAIRRARSFMLHSCISVAVEHPGIFALTMPTGGGKTLSSMAFALRHAQIHGLQRVILVVPYTSIIEQNAHVLRQALGEDAVLEHHSNYSHPEEEGNNNEDFSSLTYMLSTENWNASVIVTTSVQFFESLFSNRPSRCRKLHNITRSVVIFDEIQMLPIPYIKPCLVALRLLANKYGSSLVFCSATQPALQCTSFLEEGFRSEEIRNIISPEISPELFRIFERTQVENKGVMNEEALVEFIEEQLQVLCIVNSRKHARDIFLRLPKNLANFHLSSRMTPENRNMTLEAIRKRLDQKLPCRVVSTSLIECGVDISFPVVMREKNGLDVLVQSAGRCNREGSESLGRVFYFSFPEALPKKAAELARRCQAFDKAASHNNIFFPEAIETYFTELYKDSQHILDEKSILQMTKIDTRSRYGIWQFNFSSIAKNFNFIDEDTESIIIEKGEAYDILNNSEKYGRLTALTFRRLQRFSVQVRRYELEQMKKDGRIEVRNGFLNVLSGGVGYNDITGLDVTLENGVPVQDLLF